MSSDQIELSQSATFCSRRGLVCAKATGRLTAARDVAMTSKFNESSQVLSLEMLG